MYMCIELKVACTFRFVCFASAWRFRVVPRLYSRILTQLCPRTLSRLCPRPFELFAAHVVNQTRVYVCSGRAGGNERRLLFYARYEET